MENKPVQLSYEFFPPKNPSMARRLWRTVGQLERYNPAFFSMTYGALGSAKQISIDAAIELHNESSVPVSAHLTCGETSADAIDEVARQLYQKGLRRIVALRGDSTVDTDADDRGRRYGSVAAFIEGLQKIGNFDISVAAYPDVHPLATSARHDLEILKQKMDAGANRAITQYFFDTDSYLRFRDKASDIGIHKPLVPGILPIHDIAKVRQFSQQCGAKFPQHLETLFDQFKHDPVSRYQLSVDLAVQQCERLRQAGVSEFHLYTMNQTDLCLDISLALGATIAPISDQHAA